MKATFIQDTCELITDGTHYTPPDVGEGFPFLTVKDMSVKGLDFVNCSHISPSEYSKANAGNSSPKVGDVLFSKDGTVGKVHVVSEKNDFAILSSIAILRPKKDILDSNYFGYVLRSPITLDQAVRRKTGSAIRRIILKDLKRVKIPLPPLEEQKRIAAILDKADAVRRKRKEAIALTEELLRLTFLDMFGDPVTNPKKWDVVPMKSAVLETQYGTSAKSNTDGNGLPVLRMNNITYSGEINLDDVKWCNIPKSEEDKYTTKRGDLLFNRTNSPELVGKTAIWRSSEKYAIAGYLVRVRFKEKSALPEYISAFLNSTYGKKYLFEKAKPSNNMSNFSASEFVRIPILLPPLELQKRFETIANKARSSICNLENLEEHSETLFNSLLQKAFRGEL